MYGGVIRMCRIAPPSWHMVHAPVGERPTPRDAPHGHEAPLARPVDPDRVLRVPRARGIELALAAEPPRQRRAIHPDQRDQEPTSRGAQDPQTRSHPSDHVVTCARFSSSSISATRSCVLAPRIVPRATHAMSNRSRPGGASSRHAARMILRARLRTTAPPTRRPTTNATVPRPGATKATTRSPWRGRPCSRIRRTSVALRRTGGRDPSHGDAPRSRGPHGSASGPGSRGSSSACGCWAGTFAWTSQGLLDDGRQSIRAGIHAGQRRSDEKDRQKPCSRAPVENPRC